jgi:hypothetical protein
MFSSSTAGFQVEYGGSSYRSSNQLSVAPFKIPTFPGIPAIVQQVRILVNNIQNTDYKNEPRFVQIEPNFISIVK